MDLLEAFLIEDLPLLRRDLNDIDKLLYDSEVVYSKYFDKTSAWPYEVISGSSKRSGNAPSTSTTSMILAALLRLDNKLKSSDPKSIEFAFWPSTHPGYKGCDENLLENVHVASDLLLNRVMPGGPTSNELTLVSQSFGNDDVFTLCWLATVSMADWSASGAEAKWKRVSELCLENARKTLETSVNLTDLSPLLDPRRGNSQANGKALDHAFAPLRLVQTIRRIQGNDAGALAECSSYFERRLHQQLSFSSIPDSRFDPAELAFCLEGMLLSQRNTVDNGLFDRVVNVLTSVQSESAFWRPVKPYIATEQGYALFPVSVEVANSLVRSCFIFDRDKLHDTYASKCIPLLKRYWQWLRARTVISQIPETKQDVVGWHSEHVNEPTVIHLWETSQVIEFLLGFRNILYTHIGRTALIKSRLSYKNVPKTILDLDREPVSELGENLRVYARVQDEFLNNRNTDSWYSMLLYGPPGTGKTTVAEAIASALGQRLITITVSDFLAEGAAQVEARVKGVFDVLMSQPACVVLFDEIDHFLLDRDSDRYAKQDTYFQFMTPGMLTKLNDLRRLKRVLFIVATNYEDRIDSAVKRTGRIDRAYLVLPPDKKQRETCLKKFMAPFPSQVTTPQWKQLAEASLFLGWRDMESAVDREMKKEAPSVDALIKSLQNWARTCSLEIYSSRFEDKKDVAKVPMGEFLCLVALLLETPKALTPRGAKVIQQAAVLLAPDGEALTAETVLKYARDLGDEQAARVAQALREPVKIGLN